MLSSIRSLAVRSARQSLVRQSSVWFATANQRLSSSELEEKRRRMLYHSKQRGWLELDLILGTFADQHLAKLSEKDVLDYENVLEEENPDLFKWLSGQSPIPQEYKEMEVVKLLLKHIHENHPGTFQNQ
jgi:succinate dehydrogenase flavin-adding protein (antitoxin of CptAB toxin-antitoxin module)